jgi:outer membrane lipoprotein-sorting protein
VAVLRIAFVIVISVFATACTGKSNPAAPTAPAATNISISGTDALLTGSSSNDTATATLSDGTTRH